MNLKAKLLLSFLLLGILSASPVGADSTVADISKELVCQCGCNMVLSNCSHSSCISREAMTAFIEQELDRGQSKAEIIDSFVRQYGEQVLSAPPKRGFNLMVWVLPPGALVLGGGVVYVVLRAWVRHGRFSQITSVAPAEEGDDESQERLEQELDQFTEEGFR